MEFTQADAKILNWFRKKGELILQGNREYYETLEFLNGKYIYRYGDTMINEDIEVKEIAESEVLSYLKSHIADKAKLWAKMDIKTSEEIWNYIEGNGTM